MRGPLPLRQATVLIREGYHRFLCGQWERKHYPNLPQTTKRRGPIKNVLVYMISGLHHSGTEKSLQRIANALVKDYHVFFMYGDHQVDPARKNLLDTRIKLIPFSYDLDEVAVPHKLHGMRPHLKEVLVRENIDLILTSSPGYAHYPWNMVDDIPIVFINIFGAPALKKNIVSTVYISELTRDHATHWTGTRPNSHVRYLPCEQPLSNARALGVELRADLNIPKDAFVFGRIGRADNNIYDPIGLKAWRRITHRYSNVHFIVKSPPPILEKSLKDNPVPNMHLLPPSGTETDIWAFHGALDAMAHFRYDGETSGVAIAESLMLGNPIVTHRSHVWNAHLEYLTPECARVASQDNDKEYAGYLEEFIHLKSEKPEEWAKMRLEASNIARNNFSAESFGEFFRDLLKNIQNKP